MKRKNERIGPDMTDWLIPELVARMGVHLWVPGWKVRTLEAAKHILILLASEGYEVPTLIVGPAATRDELDMVVSAGETRSAHIVLGPGAALGDWLLLPKSDFLISVGPTGAVRLTRGGDQLIYRHFTDCHIKDAGHVETQE